MSMSYGQTLSDRCTELLDAKYGEGEWNRIDDPTKWAAEYTHAVDEWQALVEAKLNDYATRLTALESSNASFTTKFAAIHAAFPLIPGL